ncbi:unnamed protein product [Calypogeia fissa]
MDASPIVMKEFPDLELRSRSQDPDEYVRLGHSEEDDELEMEEFELRQPDDISWRRKRLMWWAKVSIVSLALIAVGSAAVFWGGPFILDRVVIPMLVWEASTFSKPVLALVLVLSLALFPIVLLPSAPSMWLTGMIFGYGLGYLIINVGTFLGQTFPYLIGRWVLHHRIQELLTKRPKQAAVLRIAEQGSWFYQIRSIVILRFSPIPYPIFNYAITGTNITFAPYIMGSMLWMIPEAFITIYTGKMLKDLADLKKDKMPLTWPKVIYYLVNFAVAISIMVGVTVLGHRALKDLELREAAEREENETPMRGVVDDVEEASNSTTFKRSTSWSGETETNGSSIWGKIERAMSFSHR